jgi:hypothetical protein
MMFLNIKDPAQLLFPTTKEVEQHLVEYIVYLRDEKKITYATRNLYVAAVFTFYAMNNITEQKENLQICRAADTDTRIHRDRADVRILVMLVLVSPAAKDK